ncbi:MAG: helix-turn-helix domain-containing protein, partial [Nanoarchaeota archaeon]|nr:helix-turn-helix domain-containing protein [Nanoarchaeota archaeon]
MGMLTEKKRKWIIKKFRSGRSTTSIARIQRISRQTVYVLAAKYKAKGKEAYKTKKAGRPKI